MPTNKKAVKKTATKKRSAVKRVAKKLAISKTRLKKATRKAAVKAVKAVKSVHKGAAKAIPFVIKDSYIQLTVGGQPFSLDSTHPTFARMKKALESGNWKAVPRLVNLAQSLFDISKGNVEVKGGTVLYKGSPIHDSFTQRILDMIKSAKDVAPMLLFLDDLYKNPSREARREFGDWFIDNDLPITDDGSFLAYKYLDQNLMDTHTGTIDNSPGRIITGSRKWFDTSFRTQCSSGFHVCSKQYGTYGSRAVAVKVRPRDVLSAEGGKMRVVRYEVIRVLGSKTQSLFTQEGYSALEKQLVVAVGAERKELVKILLGSGTIKRLIKNGKLKKTTIECYPYARLKTMAQRYELVPAVESVPTGADGVPPLFAARKASGLTVGQVAKQMKSNYKATAKLECQLDPSSADSDNFIEAIAALKKIGRGGFSFSASV